MQFSSRFKLNHLWIFLLNYFVCCRINFAPRIAEEIGNCKSYKPNVKQQYIREESAISELDNPPANIQAELVALRKALDDQIPPKTPDRNLLIATWNLRAFGDLTEKWETSEKDSPKRNLHALRCIVDIISRFDIIAIQEVKDNLKCLRETIKALGPNWMFIMTDVTKG